MRFSYFSKAVLPLVAVAALGACTSETASPDEPISESSDELVNAPRDLIHTWSVGVCASAPNTDPTKGKLGACVVPETRCTGSLVAPNLVLTARHCTNPIDWTGATGFCDAHFSPDPLTDAGARITLNASVLAENPAWIKVREVLTAPTNNSCDDDVALLVLETPVATADAKPISLQLENLGTKWWLRPSELAIVGRGILTSIIDPVTLTPIDETEDLTRRYAEHFSLRCISNQPGKCSVVDITSPPSNHFTLSTGQFLFGRGSASGDSGSALIAQNTFKTDHPIAIGVVSAGTYGKNGVGNAGLGVRLDRHATWLRAGAVKAASAPNAGAYSLPSWAKP
jgi:Trypsin